MSNIEARDVPVGGSVAVVQRFDDPVGGLFEVRTGVGGTDR
jgi:hypothetical protein